ncbi:molybdenum cofactor biosynthesis protein MoaE [Vitreimonas flagellata]|uniref:molybdenum cofactor biosynthesis protein MoaE n=1 Tax=Vitreimonas flagellata TaxID=2560861 RepID=UPI001EF948F7|nr:molybdenum cofactor biosynthesis protein MoaE [Vitreimonas flagellata]
MMHVVVTAEPFAPAHEVARFAAVRSDQCGALASFVGYCRGHAGESSVTALELEHYPGFTEGEIERLAQQVGAKHALDALLVIHRVGIIPAGEAIVLVAAQSAHRANTFAAVEEMMDYLKTDAPLWKRESGPDGARWIEPTNEDYARRQEHGA